MAVRGKEEIRPGCAELHCDFKPRLNTLRCPSEFNGVNHIHLLVYSNQDRQTIPRALQLVAGRVGQEYNLRKNRKGAFWEDRYHATAVDTDEHLIRCLTYIDLNMVRAGVVSHPREWRHGGWHEIINPPRRYRIIARERLKQLLDADEKTLTDSYEHWVDDYIQEGTKREKVWTEAVAAGSAEFVEGIYPV